MTKLAKEVLATNYAKGGIVAFSGENGSSVDDEDTRSPAAIAAANNAIVSASPIVNKGIAAVQDNAAAITPIQETAPVQEAVTPAVQKGIAPTIDESMVSQQQDVAKLREEAAKPEEQLMAEDKKRRDDALGADTATIEYRKKIMDERANAPDEARRQMYMRLMEFGANWACTPGAPLVAGMKAIKEGLPGVMADTKANKKAMKDIDASIYALDHADRLEKAGYLDRAAAKKEKASEHLMLAAPQLVDAAIKKETLDQDATIAENKDKTTRYVADTGAGADIQRANILAGGTKVNKPMTENQRIGNNVKVAAATNTELNKDINYTSESDPTKKREMYDRVYSKYHSQIFGQNTPTGDTVEENPLDLVAQVKAEQEKRKQAALSGAN